MLPCSSVSFGAGSVPQSLLLRGTCLSAGYEPRRATDHGPRLLPGHGDAEPLLGVNEMVVVVDAKVDLDPMDLAGEALLRVLACPGSAHCVVALVQNALKPSKMPPFKPESAPFRVHFWFLGCKPAPLSRVFATRTFHCTGKAAICGPSLPPTSLLASQREASATEDGGPAGLSL